MFHASRGRLLGRPGEFSCAGQQTGHAKTAPVARNAGRSVSAETWATLTAEKPVTGESARARAVTAQSAGAVALQSWPYHFWL